MAKEGGVGFTVSVDDNAGAAKAITNDIFSLTFGTPKALADITGLDKSAIERLALLADFNISLTMGFNDAADRQHAVFKTVPLSTAIARTVALAHSGQTLTNEALFSNYSFSRGQDGNIQTQADGALSDGTTPTWS